MVVRALKEEKTAVKLLYVSIYCTAVAGVYVAAVIDRRDLIWPNAQQMVLLLCCGATLLPC